jgi:peptidoglycan endopeptidase LytE
MAHRSIVRWLAPIVLVATVTLVGWVISSSLSDPSSMGPTVDASPAGSATHDRTPSTTKTPSSSTIYTVKSGDFLTTVSTRTGMSLERLRELNPGLDARSLQPGQKIRLAAPGAG